MRRLAALVLVALFALPALAEDPAPPPPAAVTAGDPPRPEASQGERKHGGNMKKRKGKKRGHAPRPSRRGAKRSGRTRR